MKLYSKFRLRKLCIGLSSKEFRCKCDHESCRAILISDRLIEAYENLRVLSEVPFKINSGFRCTEHNHRIGGKPLSRHLTGEAVDVDAKNILEFYNIERFKYLANQCGFTYVDYYPRKKFFHLDVRLINPS